MSASSRIDDHGRRTRDGSRSGPSAGRRGLALVAGFWVVIVALLGARVALFDEIAASRLAAFIGTQVASLSALVPN